MLSEMQQGAGLNLWYQQAALYINVISHQVALLKQGEQRGD